MNIRIFYIQKGWRRSIFRCSIEISISSSCRVRMQCIRCISGYVRISYEALFYMICPSYCSKQAQPDINQITNSKFFFPHALSVRTHDGQNKCIRTPNYNICCCTARCFCCCNSLVNMLSHVSPHFWRNDLCVRSTYFESEKSLFSFEYSVLVQKQ